MLNYNAYQNLMSLYIYSRYNLFFKKRQTDKNKRVLIRKIFIFVYHSNENFYPNHQQSIFHTHTHVLKNFNLPFGH